MAKVEFNKETYTYEEFFVFVEGRQYLICFRDTFTGEIDIIKPDQFAWLEKKIKDFNRHYQTWKSIPKPKMDVEND